MKTNFLLLFFFAAAYQLNAQSPTAGKIAVIILNDKQSAVENATVQLLKSKDSSLVKTALTGKDGLADFDKILLAITCSK